MRTSSGWRMVTTTRMWCWASSASNSGVACACMEMAHRSASACHGTSSSVCAGYSTRSRSPANSFRSHVLPVRGVHDKKALDHYYTLRRHRLFSLSGMLAFQEHGVAEGIELIPEFHGVVVSVQNRLGS